MNKIAKFFGDRKVMNKSVAATSEAMKVAAEIGNSVLMGSTWAICTVFPWVGIPLKICAGMSAYLLAGVLTDKTNAAIDNSKNFALDLYNDLMDRMEDEE